MFPISFLKKEILKWAKISCDLKKTFSTTSIAEAEYNALQAGIIIGSILAVAVPVAIILYYVCQCLRERRAQRHNFGYDK